MTLWDSANHHCDQDIAFSSTTSWLKSTPGMRKPFGITPVRHTDAIKLICPLPIWEMHLIASTRICTSQPDRPHAVSYTHLDVYKRQVTNVYHLTLSHSIFTDDGSRWHCRKVCFAENIGLRLNSLGRNFNTELLLCCR